MSDDGYNDMGAFKGLGWLLVIFFALVVLGCIAVDTWEALGVAA